MFIVLIFFFFLSKSLYFFYFLFNCFNFLNCCSSTVVSIFTPICPILASAPQTYPMLVLSMCPLYMFLDDLSPSFLCYTPSTSPLFTVSLFFISMFLVIFCLLVCFVDQVPPIGDMIRYLSFAAWLISLSIMLSRSIHAVTKGRSSFFLSVAQYSIV